MKFFTISCRNINLLYSGAMEDMYAITSPAIAQAHDLGIGRWSNLMRDWTSHALFGLGRLAEAQTIAGAAQAHWEQTNDHWGMIWSLGVLAMSARAEDRFDEARDRYRRLLSVNQELGFRRGILHTLNNLGITSLAVDEPAAAEGYLIEGLRVSNEIGQIQESLAALSDIAIAREQLGHRASALSLVDAVIAHPASDQHQRYNPRAIREIAQEHHARLVEAGASLDPAAPPPTFEAVVDSLLDPVEATRPSN